MDNEDVDEAVLTIKLPKPLECNSNKILQFKGKLKKYPEDKKIDVFSDMKNTKFQHEIHCKEIGTPQFEFNQLESRLKNEKSNENTKNCSGKKNKTDAELYQDEKQILLEEFENSLKEIKEEDIKTILKEDLEFKSQWKEALKVRQELINTLKIENSGLSLNDQGKYLQKTCQNPKKWTLVLEIQGILQYISAISSKDCDLTIPVFKNGVFLYKMYVKNRNDLAEFLFTMSKNFELIIFSELLDETLFALTQCLEEVLSLKFDYVIGNSHSFYKNSSITIKNMNCLLQNRQKENIIMVDYNLSNSCFYLDNTIFVSQFKGKEDDQNFLKYLAKYLLMKINHQ